MYRSDRLALGLVFCLGCRSGNGNTGQVPDAPPAPDAGIDAATRGTVTITVLDLITSTGAPAVGTDVVFLDPDGTLVKRATTDSDGKAQADVLPGGSVTGIGLAHRRTNFTTVLGIKPGDDLVLGTKPADDSVAGTFSVTYPAFSGAASYDVVSPCDTTSVLAPATGAAPDPAQITIRNSCKLDPMELIVVAWGPAPTGPVASISKAGIAFIPGGSTTIDGDYQAFLPFTASYTDVDPIISNLEIARTVPAPPGWVDAVAWSSHGTTATLTATMPRSSGGQITTNVARATGSTQAVVETLPGTVATYGFDVGATLLPWLGQPTLDGTSRKLVIPTDTTGTTTAKPDLFRILALYSRDDVNHISTVFNWVVFGPDASDIVIPTFPADLASLPPTAADGVVFPSAVMIESDSATYDQMRNDLGTAYDAFINERPSAAKVRISRAPPWP
ncbi:MAG TPA: hypothetical protein VHW23_30175 [Kofleriaceae bacterium]|jgi:hypothetical protein|nr:hypothetical protein [Kofleriaceae bacterium]